MILKKEKLKRKLREKLKKIKIGKNPDKEKLEEIRDYSTKIIEKTKKEINRMAKLNDNKDKLRKENIEKIEQRKLNEALKKEKLEKAKKANERAEKILKNGYKLPKAGDSNNEDKNINLRSGGLGIFLEEKIEGTNLVAPNEDINKIKRPNSSIKSGKNKLNNYYKK